MNILKNKTGLKNKTRIITKSAKETQDFGETLALSLQPGDIVCLVGHLGAGKTCLAQGVARGLKVKEYVNSPTFKLINEYKGVVPVYHFDLYRLDTFRQVQDLGYEEYLFGKGISLIEWAEKIIPYLRQGYLLVELKTKGVTGRVITITDRRIMGGKN